MRRLPLARGALRSTTLLQTTPSSSVRKPRRMVKALIVGGGM